MKKLERLAAEIDYWFSEILELLRLLITWAAFVFVTVTVVALAILAVLCILPG